MAAYFLWSSGHGLRAYFTDDDMMNLYRYWVQPWWRVLWDNVIYFSPSYRPMGGVFYRLAYAVAGFDPLPFRLLFYALLLLNLFLVFRFTRRLTGSDEVGVLAALICSFHARFIEIYCNTGTVYDVLCFSFYFAALSFYVATRQGGRLVQGWRLAWFVVLYIGALDSKEMALTLPLMIGIYELVYHTPFSPDRFFAGKWLVREGLASVLTFVLAIPYVVSKLFAGPLANHPLYTPVLSVGQFMDTWCWYLDQLLYSPGWFTPFRVIVLFGALSAVAWLRRSRNLKFSLLFIIIIPLPILFIPARGGFAFYVPMAGWALYAAIVIVEICEFAPRRILRIQRPSVFTGAPARLALLGLMVLALVRAHRVQRTWTIPCRSGSEQEVIRTLARQLGAHKRPPPNSRILFVADPFAPGAYTPKFIVALYYGDRSLTVEQVPARDASQQRPPAQFVIGYKDQAWMMLGWD
ncbi:MAG: hypothetical protein HY236_09945 [Acidobacteria bacterium]|nr:hypothetical protein [Acidobacteriota bacterium]